MSTSLFQLELYDQNESDSERNIAKRQFGRPMSPSIGNIASPNAEKSSLEKISKNLDEDEENGVFYPIPGAGKRAHITLGTSEGVRPVNTGIDLLEAVNYEKQAAQGSITPATFTLPGNLCFIHNSQMIVCSVATAGVLIWNLIHKKTESRKLGIPGPALNPFHYNNKLLNTPHHYFVTSGPSGIGKGASQRERDVKNYPDLLTSFLNSRFISWTSALWIVGKL